MHRTLILAAVLLSCACATSSKDPAPPDWPAPQSTASECTDVAGTYVDPNAVRGKTIVRYANGYSESGGTFDAAWLMFGFFDGVARQNDASVKARLFSISFTSQKSIVITYSLNGEVVATKEILPTEYKCEAGMLKFVAYLRKGEQVFDMFPNHGTISHSVELLRSGNHLYAKFTRETVAVTYGVIPDSHTSITWPRFPAR